MIPMEDGNNRRERRDRTKVMMRIFVWTVAGILALAVAARGSTIYSGMSVGSTGTVYAWGVTDADVTLHTAYVSTTLVSPGGRRATAAAGY
jgi:hypothetical protein